MLPAERIDTVETKIREAALGKPVGNAPDLLYGPADQMDTSIYRLPLS
jgi:hypothetical protein